MHKLHSGSFGTTLTAVIIYRIQCYTRNKVWKSVRNHYCNVIETSMSVSTNNLYEIVTGKFDKILSAYSFLSQSF